MRFAFFVFPVLFLIACRESRVEKRANVPFKEIAHLKLKGNINVVTLATVRSVDVLRGNSILSAVDTTATRKYVFDSEGNLIYRVIRQRLKQPKDSRYYFSDSFSIMSDSFFYDADNYLTKQVSFIDGSSRKNECSFGKESRELTCRYFDENGKIEMSSVERYDVTGYPVEARYFNEKGRRYLSQVARYPDRATVETFHYNREGTLQSWFRDITDTANSIASLIVEDSSGMKGYDRVKAISVLDRMGNVVECTQYDKRDSIISRVKWYYDAKGNDTLERVEVGEWLTQKAIANVYDSSGHLVKRSYVITYPMRNNARGDAVSEWYQDYDIKGNYRKKMTVISRDSGVDTSWQIREFQYFK